MSYTVYRAASSDGTYTFAGNSYTTSYTNTGLAANTTYYYKTSASGSGGESVQSSYASAITQIGVPTGVSAVAQSASSIQITWNSVSGASSYTVYRSGSSGGTYTSVGTSSTSLYTNTGLIGGSTFYYKISANGANGEGAQSAAYAYATTLRSVAPTGVSATSLSASSIQIAWNSVNGASSYTVYRSGSSGGTYTSVGTSSTSSYTNTGLNAGTIYYYKVSAHSTDGESYQSSSVSAITMPTVPTGVRTYTGSSSIDIYWYDVTGASYYKVYRAISATGNYQLVNTISSSLISYSDTGLSANTMYYYKVSAVNAGGESGQSAYVSARTKVASPTVAATAQSSSVIRLNWNSVSGATSYTVYQYLGSSYHVVGSLSATSVDITGLSANTSYSFVVSATGAEGEGNLSPIVSAITL
jgi:fibronectin type 3 domain-containing protein